VLVVSIVSYSGCNYCIVVEIVVLDRSVVFKTVIRSIELVRSFSFIPTSVWIFEELTSLIIDQIIPRTSKTIDIHDLLLLQHYFIAIYSVVIIVQPIQARYLIEIAVLMVRHYHTF
jgi:hypothetical protein